MLRRVRFQAKGRSRRPGRYVESSGENWGPVAPLDNYCNGPPQNRCKRGDLSYSTALKQLLIPLFAYGSLFTHLVRFICTYIICEMRRFGINYTLYGTSTCIACAPVSTCFAPFMFFFCHGIEVEFAGRRAVSQTAFITSLHLRTVRWAHRA